MPENQEKNIDPKLSMGLMVGLPPNLQRSPKARAWFGTLSVVLLILAIIANGVVASGLLSLVGMRVVACIAMVSSGLATLFSYWTTPPAKTPKSNPTV
jgi:hypothetical protein